MKNFLILIGILVSIKNYGQCVNDICETSIPLQLCETYNLSIGCQVDWPTGQNINLFGTGASGGCGLQWFQFDNDQWFNFTLDELTDIVIDLNTNYQAPLNSTPCSVNNNGTTQGINLILWTGDNCGNKFPIINTWNPSWCNGNYIVPPCPWSTNICNVTGCPTPSNVNVPSWVNTNSPAYQTVAYTTYMCCANWNTSCSNNYTTQLNQYNLSFNNWIVQQTNTIPQGTNGGVNPQDYLMFLTLPAGNYWVQLDPISCNPNTGGYVSQGTGTISICPLVFLNLEQEREIVKPSKEREIKKPIKVNHPVYGLIILMPDGRSLDMMGRQVTTYKP
jgi:hypothetical protein